MKPVRSDISAALAIAVERQVEEILARVRGRWAFPAVGVTNSEFDERELATGANSRRTASALRRELLRQETERGLRLLGFR